MKNIFIRYQFELIFCFTLFLYVFLYIGCVEIALAQVDPTNVPAKVPPKAVAVEKGYFMSTLDDLIFRISTSIGMAVISIGGMLLDASIDFGVLKMGSILSPTKPLGIGILEIWGVIRDVLNILFIFGLIYVGISTILDNHKSETQRTLGYLIVAALLINFSLYATQVFIDFTNILAIQVHNQIIGTSGSLAQGFSQTTVPLDANSISGAFLNVAGVTSFLGGDGSGITQKLSSGQVFFYSIFMMVFLIVAGIVFAMGAVLLITRFAALVLYMIFSPLMFAGWIFPAFGSKAEEFWSWDKLMKQALFAPAFLFMLYLSLVVLQKLQGIISPKGGQFSDMIASGASAVDSFSMVMFFALMIVFLFASIKIATSMGVAGASYASKLTGQAIGGLTFGMAARAGRGTFGNVGQRVSNSGWLRNKVNNGGLAGALARGTIAGGAYVGDSSFDARQTGATSNSFIDFGKGLKGGAKTRKDEIEKQEKKKAESYGEIDDEDKRVKELKEEEHHLEEELAVLKRSREDASKEDKAAIDTLIHEKQDEIKAQKEHIIQEKNRRQIGAYADPASASGTAAAYAEASEAREKASQSVVKGVEDVAESQKKLADRIKDENDKLAEVIENEELIVAKESLVAKREELILADKSRSDDEHKLARERKLEAEERQQKALQNIASTKKATRSSISKLENDTAAEIKKQRVEIKDHAKAVHNQNTKIKELKKQAQKEAQDQGYAGVLEKSGFFGSAIYGRSVGQDHSAGKAVRKQYKKGRLKEEAKAHGHDDHSGGGHDDHGAKGGGKDAHAAH